MKDKNMIWYLGYVISIILVLIIFLNGRHWISVTLYSDIFRFKYTTFP